MIAEIKLDHQNQALKILTEGTEEQFRILQQQNETFDNIQFLHLLKVEYDKVKANEGKSLREKAVEYRRPHILKKKT